MERVFTAAVELAVDVVLLAQLDGAVLPVALFEVRGEPARAESRRGLLAQGVDAHSVLVPRESQRGAKVVKAALGGQLRRLLQTQAEALGAALSALRLVFQTRDAGVIVPAPVRLKQDTDPVGKAHVRHELFKRLPALFKFRFGVDVGVIPQQRQVKMLRQIFQHGTGAWAAADMQQHPRPVRALFFDDAVKLPLIVSSVHNNIIAQRTKKSYHHLTRARRLGYSGENPSVTALP